MTQKTFKFYSEAKIAEKLQGSYRCFLCDIRPETKDSRYVCEKCQKEKNRE